MRPIPYPVSYDTCARINALLRFAHISLWCYYPGTKRLCRVLIKHDSTGGIKPGPDGRVLILVDDLIEGEKEIEQGKDVFLWLKME